MRVATMALHPREYVCDCGMPAGRHERDCATHITLECNVCTDVWTAPDTEAYVRFIGTDCERCEEGRML